MKTYTVLRYIGMAISLAYLVGLGWELASQFRDPSFGRYGWESLIWITCCVIMSAILLFPWKRLSDTKPAWGAVKVVFYIAASVAISLQFPKIFDIYNGQFLLIALIASQIYVVASFRQQYKKESDRAAHGGAKPAT